MTETAFDRGFAAYRAGLPPEHRDDPEERRGWNEAKRQYPVDTLTEEERRTRFGDPDWAASAAEHAQSYEDALVDRLNQGLPLTKIDRREARRIIKARAAAEEACACFGEWAIQSSTHRRADGVECCDLCGKPCREQR